MASRSGPYDIVARVFRSSCTRASPAGASRTPCRALAFHDIAEGYLILFHNHIHPTPDRRRRTAIAPQRAAESPTPTVLGRTVGGPPGCVRSHRVGRRDRSAG